MFAFFYLPRWFGLLLQVHFHDQRVIRQTCWARHGNPSLDVCFHGTLNSRAEAAKWDGTLLPLPGDPATVESSTNEKNRPDANDNDMQNRMWWSARRPE